MKLYITVFILYAIIIEIINAASPNEYDPTQTADNILADQQSPVAGRYLPQTNTPYNKEQTSSNNFNRNASPNDLKVRSSFRRYMPIQSNRNYYDWNSYPQIPVDPLYSGFGGIGYGQTSPFGGYMGSANNLGTYNPLQSAYNPLYGEIGGLGSLGSLQQYPGYRVNQYFPYY